MESLKYLSQINNVERHNIIHAYQTEVSLKKGDIKKYLVSLGIMLLGAGLVFVLMHGEVGAKVFGNNTDDSRKLIA